MNGTSRNASPFDTLRANGTCKELVAIVAIVATYKRAVKVYRDPKRLTAQPVHLPAIARLKVERPQSLCNIFGKTRKSPSYDCQTPILPLKSLPVFFEPLDRCQCPDPKGAVNRPLIEVDKRVASSIGAILDAKSYSTDPKDDGRAEAALRQRLHLSVAQFVEAKSFVSTIIRALQMWPK